MIGASFAQNQLLTALFAAFDGARAAGGLVEGEVVSLPATGGLLVKVAGRAVLAEVPPQLAGRTFQPGQKVALKLDTVSQPPRVIVTGSGQEEAGTPRSGADSARPTDLNPPRQETVRLTAGAEGARSARTVAGPFPDAPEPLALRLPVSPAAVALAGSLIGKALGRQGGLAPLFAALTEALPQLARIPAVAGVKAAVENVLAQRIDGAKPITPELVRRALQGSGAFLESRLAAGEPTVSARTDLKAALTALIGTIRQTGVLTVQQPAIPEPAPAPPRHDALPEPQPPTSAPRGGEPAETLRLLHAEADAALERIKLHQFASLPDGGEAFQREARAPETRLTLEIPIALQRETAVAGLVIEQDGRGGTEAEARPWRLTVAVDLPETGPVYGVIALRGAQVSVALWSERPETTAFFAANEADLRRALGKAAFDVTEVQMMTGRPPERPRSAGYFLDRAS